MKRDKKLVIAILLVVEKFDSESVPLSALAAELSDGDPQKKAIIDYHVVLMATRGLLVLNNSTVALTWDGYDYLDDNRPTEPMNVKFTFAR